MRIATWNVNSLNVRLPQVMDWLAQANVDVLALQELKLTDDKFPHDVFASAGYQTACFGQKTYNGVALISRHDINDVVRNLPHFNDEQSRVITATIKGVRVIGAYFPNGQVPDSDKFVYKMHWLEAMHQWCASQLAQHPHTVLLGDFNITRDDTDVWDPVGLANTIHCTPEERLALQRLLDLGLVDSVRELHPNESIFSWWDYREFAFRRNRGMRIDHVLISRDMRPGLIGAEVDKQPRKNERPSDHAPVIIDWTPSSAS
ncbi:MAG: hypothetical protein RLZZ397_1031 [Pseudomonadota bacterium]|jgi:exodeoxyribonuclease-3